MKTIKHWLNRFKKIQIDTEIACVRGLEELMFWKCLYYLNWSMDSMQSTIKIPIFHRKKKNTCRKNDICYVSTCPISNSHSKASQYVQIQLPSHLAGSHWESRMRLEPLQAPFPELSLLPYPGRPNPSYHLNMVWLNVANSLFHTSNGWKQSEERTEQLCQLSSE